jgi:hypothetical protein
MGEKELTKEDAEAMCQSLLEVCRANGFVGVAAVVIGDDHEGASIVGAASDVVRLQLVKALVFLAESTLKDPSPPPLGEPDSG